MAEQNPRELQKALATPFAPEDLEWRLQTTLEDKMRGLAVAYVTNRAIQNRLDEVCGPDNWYNDFKPWHSNGRKESQLCGIAIYFEGRGFITKWDGAEDSDIEPVKGGLSDSMKRAAYQWGVGRVLYSLDPVWVDIERRGKSYAIRDSERAKLDNAYLSALSKLGLTPAVASGIQSLLTPKSAPEEKALKSSTSAPPSMPEQLPSQGNPQQAVSATEHKVQAEQPTGNTIPFGTQVKQEPTGQELHIVRNAKIQGGMNGSSTLVMLETPNRKQISAYVRGARTELMPGTLLANVKLVTRKQDTVVFYVLESYEIVRQEKTAA